MEIETVMEILFWCAWWWACYSAGSHDLLAVKQVNANFMTQHSPGVLFTWCSPWNRTEVWPKGLRFSPVVLSNQKIIKLKFNLGGPPHTCPEHKPSSLESFFPRSKIESALLEGTDRKGKFKRIIRFLFVEKEKPSARKIDFNDFALYFSRQPRLDTEARSQRADNFHAL